MRSRIFQQQFSTHCANGWICKTGRKFRDRIWFERLPRIQKNQNLPFSAFDCGIQSTRLATGLFKKNRDNRWRLFQKNLCGPISRSIRGNYDLELILWIVQPTKVFQLRWEICFLVARRNDNRNVGSVLCLPDRLLLEGYADPQQDGVPKVRIACKRETHPEKKLHRSVLL